MPAHIDVPLAQRKQRCPFISNKAPDTHSGAFFGICGLRLLVSACADAGSGLAESHTLLARSCFGSQALPDFANTAPHPCIVQACHQAQPHKTLRTQATLARACVLFARFHSILSCNTKRTGNTTTPPCGTPLRVPGKSLAFRAAASAVASSLLLPELCAIRASCTTPWML